MIAFRDASTSWRCEGVISWSTLRSGVADDCDDTCENASVRENKIAAPRAMIVPVKKRGEVKLTPLPRERKDPVTVTPLH